MAEHEQSVDLGDQYINVGTTVGWVAGLASIPTLIVVGSFIAFSDRWPTSAAMLTVPLWIIGAVIWLVRRHRRVSPTLSQPRVIGLYFLIMMVATAMMFVVIVIGAILITKGLCPSCFEFGPDDFD